LYDKREELNGPELMRQIERFVMLSTLDENWQEHLTDIRDLREGIGLRAYGQRDPLIEYKKEAFEMFSDLVERIDEEIASKIFRVHARHETAAAEGAVARKPELQRIVREGEQRRVAANTPEETTVQTVRRSGKKIGRNDPCPCGSGKKYKKCHGKKGE
jgi:preprotein translocase subunit SecA